MTRFTPKPHDGQWDEIHIDQIRAGDWIELTTRSVTTVIEGTATLDRDVTLWDSPTSSLSLIHEHVARVRRWEPLDKPLWEES